MSSRPQFVVALVALAWSARSAAHPCRPSGEGFHRRRCPRARPTIPSRSRSPGTRASSRSRCASSPSLPDIDGVAARMMTLVEEPRSRRLFVSDMRGVLYTREPGRQDGDPVPRCPRSEVGRLRAVAGARARDAEFRAPPAVRAGRHAGIRQALYLHRRLEPGPGAGLHDTQREHHARHGVDGMDREDAWRGDL